MLFVAESVGTAHDFAQRLTELFGGHVSFTWIPYVAPPALIAAALQVYRRLPSWKARRTGVIPVQEIADGGRLQHELDRLVACAALKVTPEFVYAPGAGSAGAVVYGTDRRPIVCLNGGLIASATTAPSRFRAVVLHEFAHIHNRDVGITYATIAMWRVVLIAALIPDAAMILATSLTGSLAVGPHALIQDVLIIVMVYLTRADILRTREIYADRTAVHLWRVNRADLLSGVRLLQPDESLRTHAISAFAEIWRTHPSWRLRRRALTTPDGLFVQRTFPLFITGLAAYIASAQLTSQFGLAEISPPSAHDLMIWPLGSPRPWLDMAQQLLISGLITAVGGVVLWRAIVHAVQTGRRIPSGWRAGIWLGLGLVLGELTNGRLAEGRLLPAHPEALLILIAVIALLMAWTAQLAELRIRTYRGEDLNVAMNVGLLAPGLVLAFVLLWWTQEAWVTGWHFSPGEALREAELPSATAPQLLRLVAALIAVPGSDMSFMGLWWSVPLLWLFPLQLWLSRLPRTGPSRLPQVAPKWLVRVSRAAAHRWERSEEWANTQLNKELGKLPLVPFFALLMSIVVLFAVLWGFFSLVTAGPSGHFVLAILPWLVILLFWRRARRNATRSWLERAQPGSAPPIMNVPELRRFVRIGIIGGLVCCLGLLAEPLATRSARGSGDWQVDSIVSLGWIIVSCFAVMLVVAIVAGVTARGGYPLITALITSGITCTIGLLGQAIRGTLDGCLGPLNSLATTCAWEPARYMPLVEYSLGFLMGPGLLFCALGAALSQSIARLLSRRAPLPAPGAGQLARHMPGVGFLNTIAVAVVVGATTYQTIVMDAPLPRRDLLIQYTISPTGPIRSGISPMANWLRHVGTTLREYSAALQLLADVAQPYASSPQEDVSSRTKRLAPACAKLTGIVADAREEARLLSPSVNDELDQAWSRYISGVENTMLRCLDAEQAETETELSAAFEELFVVVMKTAEAAKELGKHIPRTDSS
ncbi:M48 family metalloprotease [Nonomuraea sp. NPDC050153]|uniref:M48 family metalloprotease n=1 Tax=Nonomuraea sp. NPDC050153 TaxID=3364359 RepID=UPI0037ACB74F